MASRTQYVIWQLDKSTHIPRMTLEYVLAGVGAEIPDPDGLIGTAGGQVAIG